MVGRNANPGILAKQHDAGQEELEIDQHDVDFSFNEQPDDLRINTATVLTQATEQTLMAR